MTIHVGILNLTPDSFSDGGAHTDLGQVLAHVEKMALDGFKVVDVGAESTRPGAETITSDAEIARLKDFLPQICKFAAAKSMLVSIDTRNAKTAAYAINQGVYIVNDVSALADPLMLDVISHTGSSAPMLVLMHNLGVPADKQVVLARDVDVIEEICSYFREKLALTDAKHIARQRIILDPGIGFGKDAATCWQIIKDVKKLQKFAKDNGAFLMIGHSRKSFLSHEPFQEFNKSEDWQNIIKERDLATGLVTEYLEEQGVDYLRLHLDERKNI